MPNFNLFQLLLWTQVVGMATLGFTAISSSWVEASIALATDHLVTVVLHGQDTERRLNNTTTKTQHQMQSGFYEKYQGSVFTPDTKDFQHLPF